jgi:hypothetical protein
MTTPMTTNRRNMPRRRLRRARGVSVHAMDASQVDPPVGKGEALRQANEATKRALDKTAKKAGKAKGTRSRRSSGKSSSSSARLAVELPVADDSDEALVEMTTGVLGGASASEECTAVFGSASACAAAKNTPGVMYECVSIDDAWSPADASVRSGLIALVGIPAERVAAAAKKCEAGAGRPVVCVNVEWEHDGDGGLTWGMNRQQAGIDNQTPDPVEAFANSFTVVYSFLPLSIQTTMFGSTTEGAVFKCVRGGAPAGTPWRILVKENGAYEQVGAMQRRPQQTDLEAALYNSIAAKSPVNDAVGKASGFLRGLMNNDNK